MAAIAQSDQSTLDTHLAAADIAAVFEILQRYPDLRHTDLPRVEKSALKAIAANSTAVRQMVLGFGSDSPSIRRFCKKYLPKLGTAAATELLYFWVESLDPLRPITAETEGLLGSCGGYASPLGQVIREKNLSLAIRRPEIEVYSDAARFAREVLEPLPSALAATDFDIFLLAFEYYYGLGIFYSMTPKEYQNPLAKHSQEVIYAITYHLTNLFQEVLRSRAQKVDQKLFVTMQQWLQAQTWLEQECWQNTAIAPIRNQFLQLHQVQVTSLNLQWAVADNFANFPQAQRMVLYRLLKDLQFMDERNAKLMATSLRYYRERYPDEAALVDRKAPVAQPAPSSPAVSAASTTLKSSESFAVDRDEALNVLYAIADELKLYGVARELFVTDLEFSWGEEFPSPSQEPEVLRDEQLIQDLRQWVKTQGKRVSLVAIEKTADAESFFDVLQRAATAYVSRYQQFQAQKGQHDPEPAEGLFYWRGVGLMLAALTFLPDRGFEQWLQIWQERISPLKLFTNCSFSSHDSLPKLMSQRFPDEAPFLLLSLQDDKDYPSCDDDWQLRLAQVYARQDERGRQTVRQKLAMISLKSNCYYRRSDWHPPYLWLVSQWWERKDAELLAIACDRCAIPMYWKGEKAYTPIVKHYNSRRGYAPNTTKSSDGTILVQEICKMVNEKHHDFLPGILQHNLQLAGEERAACTLLVGFATVTQDLTPFQTLTAEFLELLESPHHYAIAAGLELFTVHPQLATEILPDVLLALDRALSSTSTGITKQAVECLGQFAIVHGDARETVLASLENSLYSETPSILEVTLKTWKKVLSKVKAARFPETAGDRLQELASRDPKRYSKLVQSLLP